MQSWGWLRAASFGLRASYSHIAKLYHYGSCEFLFARSAQPVARRQLLSPEVFRIPLGIFLPLFRQVVQREDGRDWTHGNASATVDAFHGINVEHLFRPELVGVFLGMNAIHRTGIDTGGVFGPNAGLGNDVGHKILLLLRVLPGRVTELTILARTPQSVQAGVPSSGFQRLKSAIELSRCDEIKIFGSSKSLPQRARRNTKDGYDFLRYVRRDSGFLSLTLILYPSACATAFTASGCGTGATGILAGAPRQALGLKPSLTSLKMVRRFCAITFPQAIFPIMGK